jgi:putative oxidoreductase
MAVVTVHENIRRPWASRVDATALTLLRVVAGLMLMQHGAQKFFGVLTSGARPWEGPPAPMSQMWWAGVLELGGGLLLALGLGTRLSGFILSGLMAFAYFIAHAPRGLFPIQNGGELAALYSFVFLMFAAVGGGPYSIDGLIHRRRASRPAAGDADVPPSVRKGRERSRWPRKQPDYRA